MTTADDRAARLEKAIRRKRASTGTPTSEIAPRPRDEPAILGEMQQSLWLSHQLEPQSPAYNLSSAFRVRGPLDPARLERALNEVVARHRLLRSTFRTDGDVVLQVVSPSESEPLEVAVQAVGNGLAPAAATREAREPFDLESGPLVRMRLIEDATRGERLLLLVLHHILADERSLGFLWRELAAAYREPLSAAPPKVQYDDWIHWSRQSGPAGRRDALEFWRRRLDPPPEYLELPFETPVLGTEAGATRGRLVSRPLSATIQEGIRRLAAATGASPFMVFAFTFRLLLERYTQGRRVAFATPVSTRSHPATADMIGYFLNPLVVITAVDEGLEVGSAIRGFSGSLREALAHASLSFQTLAEELSPPRRRDRHPIFQTMFVYQETSPPPDLGDARLEPLILDLGESKFDLTLFVTEGESSLEIALEYRADRFEEVWMESLLGHYATLLEHLPEDLERDVSEVPMLGTEEDRRLSAFSRGPAIELTGTPLLPEQILDQAQGSPDAPAVICGDAQISYGELATSARSIAHRLRSAGVEEGDRIGLFIDRSPSVIAGVLGCHLAGGAYVPLDPAYPSERNRAVLEDAEVAAVVTTSALHNRLPAGTWPVISADEPGGGQDSGDPARLSSDAPAYILYTSGSTGRPKGVVVTHDNLRASNGARIASYDLRPKRFLLLPSIAFDSSVAGIFWTLATAGTLVLPTADEARDPDRLADLIAAERIDSLLCVPSLYAELLEAGSLQGDAHRLKSLAVAIVAGESCPPRLVGEHFRLLPHVRLFNEYGPTEATVWSTVYEMTDRDASRPVAIGHPIPGVGIEVVDPIGRRVPAGIPGQAWVVGRTVTDGYHRRPELTDELFDGPPGTAARRYRTGDRMAWTEDGRLLFLGREDGQIKLRGFRIEPGEVEAALLDLAGVERAAVVARPPVETRQLVAFVQGTNFAPSWRQSLADLLPDHMIPSRVIELPELPLLPNGKVDRRRLQDMALPAAERAEDPGTGSSGTTVPSTGEQALISLWEGLLGRTGIEPDDNFFELGGHSLLVVQMARAIERDFEVTVSPADVFASPTVAGLIRRIERRGGPAAVYDHLFPIQPRGRGTPLIVAIPHFFTWMLAERFRGERPVYGLRGVGLRAEGNLGRWRTMRDLGEDLVDEIQRRFPDERCIVAGYSFGATMAVEAVRLMEERGIPVDRLYLIAPMPVDIYRLGPFRLELDGLRGPVDELSAAAALRLYARDNNPLTLRPYRRAWRRLAIEPWRRLLCRVGRLRLRAGLPLTPRILHADVRVDRFRLHARYRPGVVRTPTVFFNAKEPATDAAATWRPYFEGPFEVVEIPDPHLDEASVEAAREVILSHLRDMGDA